ncbi:MAG: ABC transporter permease, partial [Acidimicrobiaceae bacterium]|nr:ABC transporter permease [Acidimicrobiaceae bacterium]
MNTPGDSSSGSRPAAAASTVGFDPESQLARIRAGFLRNGIVIALVLEVLFFWSQSEKFMTTSNIRLIFLQVAVVGIMAVPTALLLMSGYIDFAVGSTLGLSAVVLGKQLEAGTHPVTACTLTIIVAAGVGLCQGTLATRGRFAPIIVTLGFYTAVRGLTYVVNDGDLASGWTGRFKEIGQGLLPGVGIPNPVIIAGTVFIIGALFHTKTVWGRHMVALGVNAEAARRAGINPWRLPLLLYVASSVGAGVGAIVLVSRLNSAPPTLGEGIEIEVLSAILLGGVAFGGGKGNLLGVAAGVLFIGVLNDGLLLLGAKPFWVRVSAGLALVAAAA